MVVGLFGLRSVRKRMGLSLRDLEEKTGFDHVTIEAWEVGRSIPSPQAVRRLAAILGVEVSLLVGFGAEMIGRRVIG